MRRNLVIIFSLVVVLTVTTYFGLYVNNTPSDGGESYDLAEVESAETYINEKGEKWGPLPEVADFTVSSKQDAYPVFVSGLISPLDVHVGDLQKMKIVINDDVPLVEVIAHIGTDVGIKILPLELTESKALTEDFFKNRKYIVDEDGKLILNDGQNGTKNLVNKLLKTAEA